MKPKDNFSEESGSMGAEVFDMRLSPPPEQQGKPLQQQDIHLGGLSTRRAC